jgi:LPXTG-motif cell wall-anchored protein
VFGYNGFGRVFGSSGPAGGGPGGFGPGGGPPGGGPLGPGGFGPGGFGPGGFGGRGGVDEFGGTPGIGRLFNMGMGDQVMWLSLLAGAALVSGAVVVLRRRRGSDRASAASLVTFGVWAITGYALFAFSSGIFHNYYVSAIAPALAALVGIGAGLVLNGGRVSKVVAALAMAGTAAIELVLIRRVQVDEWLRVVAPLVMLIAAAALAAWAIWPSLGRWRHALIGGGVLAALLAPAMWVGSALTHAETATFPDARPGETSAGFDPGGPGGGGPGGGPGGFGAGLDAATIAFLEAHTTTERWIVAVASSQEASAPIIDGHSVMSMGGFSGTDPAMTPDRLASLVRAGELRFISAGGPVGGPGGFGGPGGPAGPGGFGGASSITNVVAEACTAVDDAAVSSTIYDCAGAADAISRAGDQ